MDIFLHDPTEIPLPPEAVRICELRGEPWPDGQRVRVSVETDPFQKPPSITLTITDATGAMLAETNVIESITRKVALTLHLRSAGGDPVQPYRLTAVLFYLPPLPAPDEAVDPQAVAQPLLVDRRSIELRAGRDEPGKD